jgi:hypothetical protein
MAFSPAALRLIMARSSKEFWLWLLTIDHADWAGPIRWVKNNQDIASNGETFEKCDFALTIPGTSGRARLAMPNASREIGFALKAMQGPAEVRFQAVLASDADAVQLDFPGYRLRNVGLSALIAEGDLLRGSDDEEPYPKVRVTPAGFKPWFL